MAQNDLETRHLETLDRDLGRFSYLENAASYVSRPLVGPGIAFVFIMLAGLAAALSLLSGRLLIRSPDKERAVLEAIVQSGAVDGCTRRCELSVDGLAWTEYAGTLEDIYRETCDWLAKHAAPAIGLTDGEGQSG